MELFSRRKTSLEIEVCVTVRQQYNDISNQQDAAKFVLPYLLA